MVSGTGFLNAPVNTSAAGPLQITNTGGILTLATPATLSLDGFFAQLGGGPVTMSDMIITTGGSVHFTGPITLVGSDSLNTDSGFGNITFDSTINGNQDLNLDAGQGNIIFGAGVGQTTPLNTITVTSCSDFNAQAIRADALAFSGIAGTATFSGPLIVLGPGDLNLTGVNFTFGNNITVDDGSLIINNSGALAFSPTGTISVTGGVFNQSGSGTVTGGGTLTTANQNVTFQGPFTLTGNLLINTGAGPGNVTFVKDLEGTYNLTIQSGTGDVTVGTSVGDQIPLQNLTVTAQNITLNGVGTAVAGVNQTMNLQAAAAINLLNTLYTAGTQLYSAGTSTNFNLGNTMTVTTTGGPLSFTSGAIDLATGSNLVVQTNGGAFSYVTLTGTTFENVTINAGTANMSPVASHINNLIVTASAIDFIGTINATNPSFTARSSLVNAGVANPINAANSASFNNLGGDVGTVANPILVNAANQIFAGATDSRGGLAVFDGTSIDNSVHAIPSNPPCVIIFNGITIADCHFPNPTPSPGAAAAAQAFRFPFMVPGVETSYFTLADDYFFLPFILDDRYFRKELHLYASSKKSKAAEPKRPKKTFAPKPRRR